MLGPDGEVEIRLLSADPHDDMRELPEMFLSPRCCGVPSTGSFVVPQGTSITPASPQLQAKLAGTDWVSLLSSGVMPTRNISYAVETVPGEGIPGGIPLLVKKEAEEKPPKEDDESLGSGRLKGPRNSDKMYYGPNFQYDYGDTHEIIEKEDVKKRGWKIVHRFRQWLKLSWNEVLGGKPRPARVWYTGWDAVDLASKYDFGMIRGNYIGPRGAKKGWVPGNLVKSGDYPAFNPFSGSGEMLNAMKKGDKLQVLSQFYTIRCFRIVDKKGKAVSSSWEICGRWCWWVLLIFISGGEKDGKGTLKGTDSKSGRGRSDGTGGRPPPEVVSACGLKKEDVLCNQEAAIESLTCTSP